MTTIRQLILGAALTGAGIILGLTAGQDAAHADAKPRHTIEQPGALLDHVTGLHDRIPGHRLDPHPGKPRTRDQARRDEDPRGDEDQAPTLPPLDQIPEPEPPVAEPTPAPTEPATPTAPPAPIGDAVDVVEDVVDVVAPGLPALPALPASPAVPALPVTLPATDTAPLPDADAPPVQPAPFPADVIGPVPAPPADPAPASPLAAVAALEVPPCGHTQPAPTDDGRGTVRRITDRTDGLPVAATLPLQGNCPGVPGHAEHPDARPALKPPGASGADLIADQASQRDGDPALTGLDVLRPRSHMPAGPAHRVDPRPA